MSIIIITGVFPPEPVASASMTLHIAEALSEKHDVIVLSPKPTRPMGYDYRNHKFEKKRFRHIILRSYTCPGSKILGRILEGYSFGKHVIKYLKKGHKNINCCYVNAWPLVSQFLIIRFLKKYSIPSVTHIQDIYPESLTNKISVAGKFLTRILIPVDRYILRNSTRVITISRSMYDYLLSTRGLEKSRLLTVYNWIDDRLFMDLKEPVSEDGKTCFFTFMFLGNLCRTANITNLIRSYSKSCVENSRLVIAGSGPEKDNLIRFSRNINDCRVEFCDACHKDVPEIQAKADVLLLSLKKNAARFALPSKLPAYMFSKKPVIACVEPGSDTACIINEANCGWVIHPEDIDGLAEQMKYVSCLEKAELTNMGENGFRYARNNFSTEGNLKNVMKIISDVFEINTTS